MLLLNHWQRVPLFLSDLWTALFDLLHLFILCSYSSCCCSSSLCHKQTSYSWNLPFLANEISTNSQGMFGINGDGPILFWLGIFIHLVCFSPPSCGSQAAFLALYWDCPQGTSLSTESTDSGSAQNTISQLGSDSPVSKKTSSDQSSEQQQQQQLQEQQEMMVSDVSRTGTEAAAATNHQSRPQEKVLFGLLSNYPFYQCHESPKRSSRNCRCI